MVVMLGEFGYSKAKESREEGMVVLAVEVCEVRRIEWKQAKRSVRLGLVGSFPAAQVSGQVPGERIRH